MYCYLKFTDGESETWLWYESELHSEVYSYRILRNIENSYVRPHIMIDNSESNIFPFGSFSFIQAMAYYPHSCR